MAKNRIFATLDGNDNRVIYDNLNDAVDKFNADNVNPIKKKIKTKSNTNIVAVIELDEHNNIIRYILTDYEFGYEMCPYCECESIMKTEFRVQHCTECGKILKPCHLCDCDYCNCEECPLTKGNWHYLGGVKPKKK